MLCYGKLFARRDVNWAYESEPEPELNGRRIFTPRGKVLGGSSSINGLVYIRGQAEDVAETVAWLLDGARRITGDIIYVDGGMHIASPRR